METTKCNKCKKMKPESSFINKTKSYKTCFACRDSSRKWRLKNKERVSKYNKLTVKKRNNDKEVTVILVKKKDDKEWLEFPSQRQAAIKLGLQCSNVNKVIKGLLNSTGGYIFKTKTKINKIDIKSWDKIKEENNYTDLCKGQASKQRILHETINGISGKKCCTCKKWIPLKKYNLSTKHWDKLRNDCRSCLVKYRKKNRRKIQDNMNKYEKNRKKTDPNFKLSKILRSRLGTILDAIKANKYMNTMKLTNCNIEFLKKHIENKFTDEMTWDNHGKWHIDHIVPCCEFELTDPKEQIICFNWRNLQPMWAIENLEKSGKCDDKIKDKLYKDVMDDIFKNYMETNTITL